MYLGSLSASLVSLGFVAQISGTGDTVRVFALVVLPTLFALGIFTFVRLVESAVENIYYGRAITGFGATTWSRQAPKRDGSCSRDTTTRPVCCGTWA
jgi:hypothetical protein